MVPLKLIISSKVNLKRKYKNKFSSLQKLLAKLVKADKAKKLDTRVIYIDDAASARKWGIKAITGVNEKNCKESFDELYKKYKPAYMVIFGAADVFPFQELKNELYDPDPQKDNDITVLSDLPYACESPYSKKIASFTNPARVVGRIPDLPGSGDLAYVESLIRDNIRQKSKPASDYADYFSVTAFVWKESTKQSIDNMFGNHDKLLECPPAAGGYKKKQFSPLSHFYNCHGALAEPNFFGQKGNAFPTALASGDLTEKIAYGTIVAAECCYGAQLLDPAISGIGIANNYLLNHALVFMGSSTIAYGPASGQGLADLICQYFIESIRCGASTGRALLEARQKFLNVNGPTLDAYELKTMAQFYILGDPSISPVVTIEPPGAMNTIENRRMNLFNKGVSIGQSTAPSMKIRSRPSRHRKEIGAVLKDTGFLRIRKQMVFESKPARQAPSSMKKAIISGKTRFRAYQRSTRSHKGIRNIEVLVVKENDKQVLGWRVYVSR